MTSNNNKNSPRQFELDDSDSRSSLQESQDMFADDSPSREQVEHLPKVWGKNLPTKNVPNVAVQEKIIICLDNHYDKGIDYCFINTQANVSEPSPFTIRNAAIRLFITNKLAIARETEFAIASIEQGGFKWITHLTSDIQILMNALSKLESDERGETKTAEYDITPLFRNVLKTISVPDQTSVRIIPPKFVVRVVLVYGNSYVEPQVNTTDPSYIKFIKSPLCVLDVLYLHERQSDCNNVELIFKGLAKVISPCSYILESSRNVKTTFNKMAQLLAHPYQRVNQSSWQF